MLGRAIEYGSCRATLHHPRRVNTDDKDLASAVAEWKRPTWVEPLAPYDRSGPCRDRAISPRNHPARVRGTRGGSNML